MMTKSWETCEEQDAKNSEAMVKDMAMARSTWNKEGPIRGRGGRSRGQND
ncbi:hypothetical protein Hdeb2414_s0095g00790511 [Helianthus debilis subsp. tardiflorus]